MRDADLKASLATIEGDPPSPEFLAALFTEVEAERGRAPGGDAVLLPYPSEPVEEIPLRLRPIEVRRRGAGRGWIRAAVAAAVAIVVILGLVVDSGRNGTQVATGRLPHGYAMSVLPDAIVQGGDGDVVIAGDLSTGLDPVVPPSYREEHSVIDELGFVAGLSVPFDLEVPGEGQDCTDLRRVIHFQLGTRRLPCGGLSAALLFADDVGAVQALDVLLGHLEAHSAGIYRQGVVLERVRDLEAPLGDEAGAFVLEQFVDARAAAQVVVIVWRTDNLIQLVWEIQDGGVSGGTQALMDVAERIERRTALERQFVGH
jgi:hypothetical protein